MSEMPKGRELKRAEAQNFFEPNSEKDGCRGFYLKKDTYNISSLAAINNNFMGFDWYLRADLLV